MGSSSIDSSRLLRSRALSNPHLASSEVCKALTYLDENADVYLGYLGWAAGSFEETYILSLIPTGSDTDPDKMIDQPLITKCFASKVAP